MTAMNPLTASGPIPAITRLTDWIKAHAVINNPDQEVGDFVESAHEIFPLMAEAAPDAAASYARQADLAKFAKNYPKLAAVWNSALANVARTAVRAGTEQATQTGLKTEDPEQTKEAFKTGLVAGGGLSAAGEVVPTLYSEGSLTRRVGNYISDTIEGMRPGTRTVAGANFETAPKTGDLLLRNLKDVPQDPATQAVDEALGHIGKTGVAKSVNRTNDMRPAEAQIIPPSRQLPGRAGFEVGPAAEPTPVVEGQTAFDPRKRQIGTRVVAGKGSATSPTEEPYYAGSFQGIHADAEPLPQVSDLGNQPEGSHREPILQYQTEVRPGSPEPGTDVYKGPGTLILTDDGQGMSVQRARQQVAQYDRILSDPEEVGQMGVRQHADILRARADMAGQLDRFDNFAASQPHLAAADPVQMVRNTHSLGDAGEQLMAHHANFWETANAASESGKEWTDLREEEKSLKKSMTSGNPVRNYGDLQEQLADNHRRQAEFFDKYKTVVAPHDWEPARSGYQDGIVMKNFDDLLQKKMGGITPEDEAAGVGQRVFSPTKNFPQEVEDFYNTGSNREVLQRTIGQQHMQDVKKLGVLFNSAERAEQSQSLYKNIISNVSRHYHGVKGMLAGGAVATELAVHGAGKVAGLAGVPLVTGTMAGIRRTITDKLINDPDFLKTFSYAIQNKIPPRTAGPLLFARMIAGASNATSRQQRDAAQQPTIPGGK
jgi:hypothetical protein